jgi:methylmalonyl-CoA mutase
MSESKNQKVSSPLLAEFPPVGLEDWRKLVDVELKGAPFDKKMLTPTSEGITLRPLYRREDTANLPHINSFPGFAPFVRGTRAGGYLKRSWDISQEIAVSSPAGFNNAACNSLSHGSTALNMVLDKATRNGQDPDWAQPEEVGNGGLSVATLSDLDRALAGIDLDQTSLFIRSGASAMPFAALLVALTQTRRKASANLRGCIEMDPLGVLSHEGRLPQSLECAYREMAVLTQWAARNAPQLQTICVHSRSWHEGGGNAVQELAFTLATAVDYLREMHERGIEVDIVAPRIRFAVTVGSSFFLEIAKLRALRMLWSRAVAAVGGTDVSQRAALHVRTSLWNKTVCDPHNNMLRTTVEAFAGVLGGCDSMQVGAFDEIIRQPDDFSRRIARNTQIILDKECNLTHVIDPAGGSWYVETLTAELAARAWTLFQEVEKLGGMHAALRAGFPQKAVAATAAEKLKAVARRRDSIVGINQYANPREEPLKTPATDGAAFYRRRAHDVAALRTSLDDAADATALEKLGQVLDYQGPELFDACVKAVVAGATLGEITRAIRINDSPSAPINPVCLTRAAAAFEKLRAATDAYRTKTQRLPSAFLCNMGSLRDHKARADFSRGFLAVGGYDVISPGGFKSPADAVEAFLKSGAQIAVICSTDENYPALVPPLAAGIRAKRPDAIIILAGYPADQIEAHKKSGVDEFIHIRADALEVLSKLHSKLGIN